YVSQIIIVISALSVSLSTAVATSGLYTLSLHDALPISKSGYGWSIARQINRSRNRLFAAMGGDGPATKRPSGIGYPIRQNSDSTDRKSTRLNSSHVKISYAVFCLKKKMIQDCSGSAGRP